jgi:putative solute:sodium symporter small subunit
MSSEQMSDALSNKDGIKADNHKKYWRDTIRLTVGLLLIWFAVSYGAGILLRDWLDQFHIAGAPLGFWFAQQGSIFVFVGLIFYYCFAMNRLERKYNIEDE